MIIANLEAAQENRLEPYIYSLSRRTEEKESNWYNDIHFVSTLSSIFWFAFIHKSGEKAKERNKQINKEIRNFSHFL